MFSEKQRLGAAGSISGTNSILYFFKKSSTLASIRYT
jgi:hypothetical protein